MVEYQVRRPIGPLMPQLQPHLAVVLLILGLNGNIEWVVTGAADFSSRLKNASPGIVLALLGGGIVIYYKPRVSDETTFDRHRVQTDS